jgi:hypothetical protein
MILCNNCQQQVDPKKQFCHSCGAQLSLQTVSFQQPPSYQQPPLHQQPQQVYYAPLYAPPHARNQGGLGFLIGGLLTIVVAILVFMFLRSHSPYQSFVVLLQKDLVFNPVAYQTFLFIDIVIGIAGIIFTIIGIVKMNNS